MSNRTNTEFLSDIQEAARRIKVYTDGMTYEIFLTDTKTQDAVIRNLEIIGEAVKNFAMEFRDRYPNVPWKSIAGIRDRLIHYYFGVDIEIVWNIVITELPNVTLQIAEIVRNESVSGKS